MDLPRRGSWRVYYVLARGLEEWARRHERLQKQAWFVSPTWRSSQAAPSSEQLAVTAALCRPTFGCRPCCEDPMLKAMAVDLRLLGIHFSQIWRLQNGVFLEIAIPAFQHFFSSTSRRNYSCGPAEHQVFGPMSRERGRRGRHPSQDGNPCSCHVDRAQQSGRCRNGNFKSAQPFRSPQP